MRLHLIETVLMIKNSAENKSSCPHLNFTGSSRSAILSVAADTSNEKPHTNEQVDRQTLQAWSCWFAWEHGTPGVDMILVWECAGDEKETTRV